MERETAIEILQTICHAYDQIGVLADQEEVISALQEEDYPQTAEYIEELSVSEFEKLRDDALPADDPISVY